MVSYILVRVSIFEPYLKLRLIWSSRENPLGQSANRMLKESSLAVNSDSFSPI